MGSEHYCLRWNNHQSNLLGVFSQLLRDESLVDVTLACSEGHSIRAHKVVLSACSSYFQTLFVDHPSRHPIVILKDVRFSELRTLIEFMYKGEVNIEYCQLSALLKTAESLKVKGLAEMTRNYQSEPDQVEPKEVTGSVSQPPRPPSRCDSEKNKSSPNSHKNLRVCNSPIDDTDGDREGTAASFEENVSVEKPLISNCSDIDDISAYNSNNVVVTSSINPPLICSRLTSPVCSDSLPGPSNMPPIQQVPLSLKKEADWTGGLDDKNLGESSSEYARHLHDSVTHRCIDSPIFDRPSSTHSSTSSTTFALQFPTLSTSLLEVGYMHPTLLGEDIFRCPSCMATFPSLWLLDQHTTLQHIGSTSPLDKPFICEQCGQSYRYRSAYVKHREQNHRARLPADKLFSCDICGMQFRYLKSFKKHRLNHALEKLHGKSNSQKDLEITGETATDGIMETHENSSDQVTSSNETNIIPTDNDIATDQQNGMTDIHADGNSSDNEKTDADQDYRMDSVTFGFQTATRRNNDFLHSTHGKTIIDFFKSGSLQRQRERRFACPFCGKCVRSKENLKLHVRKHTGERPFVCLFCGRAFGGKSDLTRHLRIHTGERPYHCDICGKCFARADYLSKHLTTHLNTTR